MVLIGVPKEIKDHEYRVGVTPAGVHALVQRGHEVLVEAQAGARVGFPDAEYQAAGGRCVPAAREVWAAEMVVKVKELQESEYAFCRRGDHCPSASAPEPELPQALLSSGRRGPIKVSDPSGGLPLLVPMSRIAGNRHVQFRPGRCRWPTAAAACCSAACWGVPPAVWW
jgi:alanine dehydrogenase